MASQWYPSIRPLEYRGYRWACDRGTREWSWKKLSKTIWISRLVNVMLLRSVLRLWLCIRVDWCLAIQFGGILIPSHQSRVGWAERSMKPWNWPNIPDPVYQHECHGGCFDSADDVVFFFVSSCSLTCWLKSSEHHRLSVWALSKESWKEKTWNETRPWSILPSFATKLRNDSPVMLSMLRLYHSGRKMINTVTVCL